MHIRRKYVLDPSTLQFLQHKPVWSEKLLRFGLFFGLSVLIAVAYGFIFNRFFGSPKQEMLSQRIEEVKLKYSLLERQIDGSSELVSALRATDNASYRIILDLPPIPSSIAEGGAGGTNKVADLSGYTNSAMMISVRSKFENLRTQTNIQQNSLNELSEKAVEWKLMWEHLPYIRPVNTAIPLGEGIRFREVHPVLGTPRWHHGQDFRCPIGTPVYATGAGTIAFAGNEHDGYGNQVLIDHGYGYRTLYGHLSRWTVQQGQKIKRGDLLGYSGNTGLSSGPHLHYQIFLYGEVANPLNFFSNDLSEEEYFQMLDYLTASTK